MFKGVVFLLKYCWKHSKIYVILILSIQIVATIMPLISIILPKYIIDELMRETPRFRHLMGLICIILSANLLGDTFISYLRAKAFSKKFKVFNKFQLFMTEKVIECDFEKIENKEFLDMREKANKFIYGNGSGFAVVLDEAVNIIGKVALFLGIITILATLNVFIVIMFILLILINAFINNKMQTKKVEIDMLKAPYERRLSYFINMVQNFTLGKEIKIYNLKKWIMNKVEDTNKDVEKFYDLQIKQNNKIMYFSGIINFVKEFISYIYPITNVITKVINIGDFTMYLGAIRKFSGAMNDMMTSIVNIKYYDTYYNEFYKYMNLTSSKNSGKKLKIKEKSYIIEFKNVYFRYMGQDEYALKDINIKIESGEKLSIVGGNGAGKTTFSKLISRLYSPTKGGDITK